ncbi:unnamed protein product [Amoebophrya sp. A120]|nr:unnamed protein product [Amoebophrya sp. A120]|eukprot:GSA120T00014935001.1
MNNNAASISSVCQKAQPELRKMSSCSAKDRKRLLSSRYENGKSLAKEGKKQNIHVNVIIPTALTAMTKTVGLQHYTSGADPGHIAPLVTYLLCSASDGITGRIFEAGPGFYAEIKFQRSGGVYFPELGTEQVRQKPVDWKEIHQYWDEITEFGENCDDPAGEENAVPRSLKLVLKMPEVVNDTGTKRQKSKL